ncbi:MAG: WD40 repeat domain-containing protein [Saprospiraceae bacterium]|nr:WD40 repeat domain-containing protein [Saprospiraceae bacterium]
MKLHLLENKISEKRLYMIKKESLKKLIQSIVIPEVESVLSPLGYKYVKTQGRFTQTQNNFKQIIGLSGQGASIEYDEKSNELLLLFSVSSTIECPKFEKWSEKEYHHKSRIYHRLNNFQCKKVISIDEIGRDDVYTPTKAQQFKSYVSRAIGGVKRREVIQFQEMMDDGFQAMVTNLNLLSDIHLIYENRPFPNHLDYVRLLEFYGKVDLAKNENIRLLEVWESAVLEKEYKSLAEKKLSIDNYNKRVNEINTRFDQSIPIWEEAFELFEFKKGVEIKTSITGVKLEEVFSISKSSSGILGYEKINDTYYQFRGDASVIVHNVEGEVLYHHQLTGMDHISGECINKCTALKGVFWYNFFIRDGEVIPLEVELTKKDKRDSSFSIYAQKYLPKKKEVVLLASNHRNHLLFRYDEAFNLLEKIDLEDRPFDVIPEMDLLLCESRKKACSVYDLKGDLKYLMPSNNAYYTFRIHYAYSLKADLFLSGWYYTKSQLFQLSTGKLVKNLWAHPTYMKGYKENLYNDINHNFGMDVFQFSPDGSYIVGGADHGKYVAWTTNNFERHELIPNDYFIKERIPGATIEDIDGKKMLKNRGNKMRKILFLKGGNYFAFQVNTDLLIWNTRFEHLDTIEDIGYIKEMESGVLLMDNGEDQSVFTLG